MFPDIKIIPCESKLEAFNLLNRIADYYKSHIYMTVAQLYEMLELSPIPENAEKYCFMSLSDFGFGRDGNMYYVGTREPIEIVDA